MRHALIFGVAHAVSQASAYSLQETQLAYCVERAIISLLSNPTTLQISSRDYLPTFFSFATSPPGFRSPFVTQASQRDMSVGQAHSPSTSTPRVCLGTRDKDQSSNPWRMMAQEAFQSRCSLLDLAHTTSGAVASFCHPQ